MPLTLCLPGLLLPRQVFADTAIDLDLPAFSQLLGRGRLRSDRPLAVHEWLMEQWRLDTLPAAAMRLLGEGGEPGGDEWLCLDPVHFEVDRRRITLAEPGALALTAAEDAALREACAPLFAGMGQLSARVPGHWYLRLARPLELTTRPLPEAIGYGVDPVEPGGPDGADWRRLLAEAQMLLHQHPVNQRREESGQARVSSLWPWGQGRQVAPAAKPFAAVWSNDPVLQGLARAAGASPSLLPPGYAAPIAPTLAVIEDLSDPARALDALRWREALERLDRDWFAPLLSALRSGRCGAARIVGFGPDASLDIRISRRDFLKFWRRPLPLARLAP